MSGLWYHETYNDRVRLGFRVKQTLFSQRSDYQLVEVFDTYELGPTLAIDGIFMTSAADEYLYHEMIAHPALTTAPRIDRVLIIGGGDGGTARETLRHPDVKSVTLVEIDGVVVEASKRHLPEGFGAWSDPRLAVVIDDGVEFAKRAEEGSFDVVLLDGSDPVGPAKGLFNEDFYRAVHRCLRPNGVFALQSESEFLMRDTFLEIQHTLRGIFKTVAPYFGSVPIYGAGPWSWTYASDGADPMAIDDARAARIEQSSKLYNREVHRGAFAMPNRLKRELA